MNAPTVTTKLAVADVTPSDITPSIETVTSVDDLQLGQRYEGITLRVEDRGREPVLWENVVGAFDWNTDLPSDRGGICAGPIFTRTFPSGQVVTLGMHTPSRVIQFALGSTNAFHHPRELFLSG